MLQGKFFKLSGGVAPFMMGIVLGVSIVSTLAAQQAFQENENYKRKYIEEKKAYIEKVNKNFENLVYTETSTDSTITQDRIKKNTYTNIFDTTLRLNVNQGSQANGIKTGSIDIESNEYVRENIENATDANRLAKDFSNSATAVYSEENIRASQKLESYKSMKKQAAYMYKNIISSSGVVWPCSYTSYKKDAWNRDFSYNVIDEYNAELSYNLPWNTSIKKILPIKLPELDADEEVKDIKLNYFSSYYSSYILTSKGNLWSAGSNDFGQLGVGNYTDQVNWVKTNVSGVDKLYLGLVNAYAVKSNGELWATGSNSSGQLGIGNTSTSTTWVKSGVDDVKDFYVSGYSIYAHKQNGELWVAGKNTNGELGLGNTSVQTSWVKSNIDNVDKVYISEKSSWLVYVIKTNGELWGVGYNSNGQLGTGNKTNQSSWFYTGISNAVDVFIGRSNSYVERSNGQLWGVGRNLYGELGTGNNTETLTWTDSNIEDVKEMHFGMSYSYVIKNNGEAWTAGLNASGQLGIGGGGNQYSWQKSSIDKVREFYAQDDGAYAIRTDGSLWVVGDNLSGQLGVDNKLNQDTWIKSNIDNVKDFAATSDSAYVVKADGRLWGVGNNFRGQLGIGNTDSEESWQMSTITNAKSVYTLEDLQSVFAIRDNGDVWAAGRNDTGNLGVGNKVNQSSMVESIKKTELIVPYTCP